jgi:hypothetical protein
MEPPWSLGSGELIASQGSVVSFLLKRIGVCFFAICQAERLMPTRQELKELTRLRVREAEALFQAACYNGAVYLCGYAVEAALKARICKLLGTEDYPDSGKYKAVYAVHNLDQLLFLAGLKGKAETQEAQIFNNWATASPWTPELRYKPPGTYTRQEALEILDAIRDSKYGVLKWIKSYW